MSTSRINTICFLVNPIHDVIYDVCCDHGLIGKALATEKRELIFIDRVGSIIDKLVVTDIPGLAFKFTEDAKTFPFKITSSTTIILAGIGGELGIEILKNILRTPVEGFEIILCLHSHMEQVHKFLEDLAFVSLDEVLIEEKKKHYEIYRLKFVPGEKLQFRNRIWEQEEHLVQDYLKDRVKHFSLKAEHNDDPEDWLSFYTKKLKS